MLNARLAAALSMLAATAVAAEPPRPLTLGMSRPYGEAHAKGAPELIEPYLTRVLGGPVKVSVYPTYQELTEALAAGQVDLAWITPLAFVRATQKNKEVTALSKAMRKGGGLFYRAAFVVKKDSPVKALSELKGKKVAWVEASSTSGYLFPRELLRKEGLDPASLFGGESFAFDHPSVCKAVREGRADVGATFAALGADGTQLTPEGCADAPPLSDFRVLAATGDIPNEVLAARAEFDPRRTNDVLAAFGRMGKDEAGKKVLKEAFRVEGWGVAVEGDFDPVLELLSAKDTKAKVAQPAPEAKPARKKGK